MSMMVQWNTIIVIRFYEGWALSKLVLIFVILKITIINQNLHAKNTCTFMIFFSRQYKSMASGELEVLRCESSLWSGHCCARCRAELGRIINRGANCRACRERICMSCREYSTATHAPEWLCIRCHKEKIEYVI